MEADPISVATAANRGIYGVMDWREKLKIMIDERGTSQAKVAKAIRAHSQQVSRWLGGEGGPTWRQAIDLAAYFGVTMDEIFRPDNKTPFDVSPEERVAVETIRMLGLTGAEAVARLHKGSAGLEPKAGAKLVSPRRPGSGGGKPS